MSGFDTNESVEETLERLSETIQATDEHSETNSGGADSMTDENAFKLVERAEGAVKSLVDDETPQEINDDIEELRSVIEAAGELLEAVDLTQASGAIDDSDIDEAIDASGIPIAIANGAPDEAIRYRALLQLIEFDELLDAIDVRKLHQNKDEFKTAVSAFVDGNDGSNWIVVVALKQLAETAVKESNSGTALTDSIDDAGDVAAMASGTQGQMKQAAIQSKLLDAVTEFREGLFETHDRLAELREQANERVTESTGDIGQPSTQNPTAYSTMPSHNLRVGTKVSTVPRDTRRSTVSNPPRIYGSRFDTQRNDNE
ncbi:hypothetical protein [Halocatena pleomorpha]|uniref:Uncharacterized protein n=1 Tax=Halocatena pleomorpha TaxID=1785090 RepID=A0A3P3RDI6_9EURY|nr:hypothetical protein [Halocatena pleomorpha]RRJ31562.1 hypothetical protein EIK79_07570 [Halocatena pleomorpha]